MTSNVPKCDLFILSAVTDLSFLHHTLPHQIKQNKVNGRRFLRIDTSPVSGYYKNNRELSKITELEVLAKTFLDEGLIDEIIKIKYDSNEIKSSYLKHFGKYYPETHCFRGYPYFGSILPFEKSNAEYIAHLDSDMLIYQKENFNWIEHSVELMEKNPNILCCLPLSGPPTKDGNLHQGTTDYKLDTQKGVYLFKNFTSRIFVVNVKRFLSLLPMRVSWLSWREPFKSVISGNGKMLCWEVTVGKALEKSPLFRADLYTKSAWSLHPPERGDLFNRMIPDLIKYVEHGEFPEAQAGHYEIDLAWWKKFP